MLNNSPKVYGKYTISDLIDLENLKSIFEDFSKSTGFTTGFVEHNTKRVLIATGWRDICVNFHRKNSKSEKYCQESNEDLTKKLNKEIEYNIRECENNMVDGATPVIIEGVHLANIFTGQVLFREPNIEEFKSRAKEFGYDEREYLRALSEVRVVNEEEFKSILKFLSEIAKVLAQIGLKNLELKESQSELKSAKLELEDLNKTLESKVKSAVSKVQNRDRVIYEQNRKNSIYELLINISHQWRQPLSAISLYAQMIEELVEDSEYENEVCEFTSKIVEESEELSDTITYFSSIYDKKIEFNRVNLNSLILSTLKPYAGVSFELKLEDNISIDSSSKILKEIIYTILDNSMQIAKSRDIKNLKLKIELYRDGEKVILSFLDNAGGIDKNILDRVFDPYITTNFKAQKRGLGLFTIKNLVEVDLNGNIYADNIDSGAKFTIELIG